ncbi:MAG: diguanylate cyclase [Oscillochloris sp.]|nr:diguanylate cyclase [Oscillochloris sp.]
MDQLGENHQTSPCRMWEALFAATSNAVLLINADHYVDTLNPVAIRLLGDGLVGVHVSSILPPIVVTAERTVEIHLGRTALTVQRISLADQKNLLIIQDSRPVCAGMQCACHEQKFYDLLMTISSALDTTSILEQVAQLAMELIGADASSIPLYDPERDRIRSGCMFNLPEGSMSPFYHRGTGIVWDLIDSREPLLINDYQRQDRAIPSLIHAGISAVIAAPIIGIDRTLFGVLALYQIAPYKGFTRHDLDQLVVIGRQTGIAIQNARLYQEALCESHRRHLLYTASVAIGAALDLQDLYRAIHSAISRLMTCDNVAIALYDMHCREISYVYIADQQQRWPSRRVPLGHGLLGHVINTGVSLRLNNTDAEIEAIFGVEHLCADATVTRAILATVMCAGEQIIGAITVQACEPYVYDSKDLEILETLSSTAAIAIQNAHLFARIQQMATIDPLTQVPNRRHFFDVASREMERTDRYGRPISLIMFDIDSFKAVNDTYGHMAGDQVLKMVATRCRDDLRDIDTVARYGGEEFVVLLPETSYVQALQVAQRLRIRISEQPVESDVGDISVTISVGVDSCDEIFAGRLEDLLDRADQALYVAKNSGRNQVIGFRSLIFGREQSFHCRRASSG